MKLVKVKHKDKKVTRTERQYVMIQDIIMKEI